MENMIENAIESWNPWWTTKRITSEMYGIHRDKTDEIQHLLKLRHVKDIVGARRCGKTTVLYQIVQFLIGSGVEPKDIMFLNFDDVLISSHDFDEIGRAVDRLNPDATHLFVDEVQQKPGWERWIKTLYDLRVHEQIFVSGSSSSVLSMDVGRALTGRHVTCRMLPFSFREFLRHKGIELSEDLSTHGKDRELRHHVMNFLRQGGFPETLEMDEMGRKAFHTNLLNDAIARDIVARFGSQRGITERMALYLITNSCQEYSLNRIKNQLEISFESAQRYMDQMIGSEIFHSIGLYTRKIGHHFKQNKKVYTVDTGLMNNISYQGEDIGRAMENAVYLELLRHGNRIYYWKGVKREEIDFVVDKSPTQLFQVCYDISKRGTKDRELRALIEGMNRLGTDEGFIITLDEEREERVDGHDVRFIPIWRFLIEPFPKGHRKKT